MRKNVFLAVVFLLLAVSVALPSFVSILVFKSDYAPLTTNVNLSYMEEETYIYAAHVSQIGRGLALGDPYVWEKRLLPSPYLGELGSLLPIVFISYITRSTEWGFALSDFIFPLILSVVIYKGLGLLISQRYFRLTASIGVLVIPFMSRLLPKIMSHGTRYTGDFENVLFFSRTPHPQISSIFLFGTFFLTVFFLLKPSTKRFLALSFATGFSLYSSPFVISTILLATIFLAPMIIKKVSIRSLAIGVLLFTLLSVPYILNMISLKGLLIDSDFLLRTTFAPNLLFPIQLRFIAFALILLYLKRDYFSKTALSYVVSASILIDLHQIITGRNLEADHWVSRILAPISTLVIFLIIHHFLRLRKEMTVRFWKSASLVLLIWAFSVQLNWLIDNNSEFRADNELKSIVKTVNSVTRDDEVVASNSRIFNKSFTGLTGRRVYLAPGDRTLANSDEQLERLCHLVNLYPKGRDNFPSRDLINYTFGFYVWEKEDVSDKRLDIENCLNSKRHVNYKIDFFVYIDEHSGAWTINDLR